MNRIESMEKINQSSGIKTSSGQRNYNLMNKTSSQKRIRPIQKEDGGVQSYTGPRSAANFGQKQ